MKQFRFRILAIIAVLLIVSLSVATGVLCVRTAELRRQLDQESSADSYSLKADSQTEMLRRALQDQEIAYAALRDNYDELRRSVAAKSQAASPAADAPRPESQPPQPSRTANPVAWLDRIRSEDPERYKQIVAAREERRQRADQWYQEQLAKLDERARISPSEEEVALTTQIADALAKRNEIAQQFAAINNLPPDQQDVARQDLRTQMRETTQQLRDLVQQDQDTQIGKILSQKVGVSDPNATQGYLADINQVLKSEQDIVRGTGRDWGGGPGGPPPGMQGPSNQTPSPPTTAQKK